MFHVKHLITLNSANNSYLYTLVYTNKKT